VSALSLPLNRLEDSDERKPVAQSRGWASNITSFLGSKERKLVVQSKGSHYNVTSLIGGDESKPMVQNRGRASNKISSIGGDERKFVFLLRVRRLLVTANAVPSSSILVNLLMEALCSSEMSIVTRATRHNIPVDGTLHCLSLFAVETCHICGNLNYGIVLTSFEAYTIIFTQ
jgi:hypothetical protein